jgi:hypothetical protein
VIEAVKAGANLAGANLARANLARANLAGAYLADADLAGAYLADADLAGAYLADADLADANLADANLAGAYLADANLADANLARANLAGAYLAGANLAYADLARAYLAGAYLADADLAGVKNSEIVIARTRIIPDEGAVIGWKKARGDRIVKLEIPADAHRSHAMGRKCRASKAVILAIYDGAGEVDEANSSYDNKFRYRVGETVTPTEPFDTNMWSECSSGIHFYITRLEAEHHV